MFDNVYEDADIDDIFSLERIDPLGQFNISNTLRLTFDRCWDQSLNEAIAQYYPGIESLQIICNNYMRYSLERLPSSVKFLNIKSGHQCKHDMAVSLAGLDRTNLIFLMLESDYGGQFVDIDTPIPDSLQRVAIGCRYGDNANIIKPRTLDSTHWTKVCLTRNISSTDPIAIETINKARQKTVYMEVYDRIL